MRRHIIGFLGLAGLIAFFVLFFKEGFDGIKTSFLAAMCLRLGIVMSAIWLGMPDLNRLFAKYPPWLFVVALAMVIALVANRNLFILVLGLIVIAGAMQFASRIIKPRPPEQASSTSRQGKSDERRRNGKTASKRVPRTKK